jgi:hypothetical protein
VYTLLCYCLAAQVRFDVAVPHTTPSDLATVYNVITVVAVVAAATTGLHELVATGSVVMTDLRELATHSRRATAATASLAASLTSRDLQQ